VEHVTLKVHKILFLQIEKIRHCSAEQPHVSACEAEFWLQDTSSDPIRPDSMVNEYVGEVLAADYVALPAFKPHHTSCNDANSEQLCTLDRSGSVRSADSVDVLYTDSRRSASAVDSAGDRARNVSPELESNNCSMSEALLQGKAGYVTVDQALEMGSKDSASQSRNTPSTVSWELELANGENLVVSFLYV